MKLPDSFCIFVSRHQSCLVTVFHLTPELRCVAPQPGSLCVAGKEFPEPSASSCFFFLFSFISTGQTKLLWELIFPICCCYFLLEMTVQVMCKCLNTKSWCLTKCHFSICCISKGSAQFKGGHSSSGVLNIVSQSPYLAECGPHARECPAHFIEDAMASKQITLLYAQE